MQNPPTGQAAAMPTRPAPSLCVMPAKATVADIDRAAAAGFDHVLLAEARMDSGPLITAARSKGLAVFVDVQVDLVPVEAGPLSDVFVVARAPTADPRIAPTDGPAAVAAIADEADAERLAEWWAPRIATWAEMGIAGVRLLGLANLPAAGLTPFLVRLRARCPGIVLFAWTPGVVWDSLATIPAGAVDFVACSLPWWDGQAEWLWRELDLLRAVAPVIVPARGSSDPLAAVLADGWMGAPDSTPEVNAIRIEPGFGAGTAWPVTGPGQPVTALLRTDHADPRASGHALLVLVNTDTAAPVTVDAAAVLPYAGSFGPWRSARGTDDQVLTPESKLTIAPGGWASFAAPALAPVANRPLTGAEHAARQPRLAVEAPSPCVDNGRFPARRSLGDVVTVEADIIADGHDKLAVMLQWRGPDAESEPWHETPMRLLNNDRWTATFPLERLGIHHYRIQAWRDAYATFADELTKKHAAGVPIALEVQEGTALVAAAAARAAGPATVQPTGKGALAAFITSLKTLTDDAKRQALLSPEAMTMMAAADDRPLAVTTDAVPVQAERVAAAFAAWYEIFPRSMSDDPARHGTFADVERHLPRIRDMGFDVLYFPPIHPIGTKNRKGRNNTLTPSPDDPGSPYAIGSPDGGHDALHPELGTIEDFQSLRAAASEHGLELAIDFAIQCSPDHPWLKQHPDWFTWRPDGTIRYAENPPKKYEDIVNVDFYADGAIPGLWIELCEVVLFWAGQGVRLFRVDNPHTKPLPFWEWMIAEVQARYPDTAFLAEAFTRPKVMYRLAKVGFSQSYTYFTWRETKAEFQEYLTELTQGPAREFFRPNFFVNTPDINPVYLQTAGRESYLARAALAATLSGLWGVYSGFELCEGTPMPGKEEYLDSEKYQLRAWDWDRPGNIVAEITQLNAIRKRNPALHSHLGVTFLPVSGDQVLFFEKATPDRSNVILVAISMDPRYTQYAELLVPAAVEVTDLLQGRQTRWTDRRQNITLTPDRPYAIWRAQTALPSSSSPQV